MYIENDDLRAKNFVLNMRLDEVTTHELMLKNEQIATLTEENAEQAAEIVRLKAQLKQATSTVLCEHGRVFCDKCNHGFR